MKRGARRILLVHYTTPAVLGGVEEIMGAHAAGLRDAGADVTILAGRGSARPRGVRTVIIPQLDSRNAEVVRQLAALARGHVPTGYAALVQRIARAIRPHVQRADRVVVHNVMTMHLNLAFTEALMRVATEQPRRFVAWTHDLAWDDERYAAFRRDEEPWSLLGRVVPGVTYVTVSEERARQLSELTGLAREKIHVVPNGIDMRATLGLSTHGARLAQRLDLYHADPLLLLPVRITRRKRIEIAIDAVAALRRRGVPAVLVVTGAPGPHSSTNRGYQAELLERAKGVEGVQLLYALGIRAHYAMVADLYALADALVLPSETEGFGIPMLEAGLHHLPIVCTDLAVLRETGGDAPVYVPRDADGEQVATAVMKALEAPAARLRSRARAHDWSYVMPQQVLPVILGPGR